LIDGLYSELGDWIKARASGPDVAEAGRIASIGVDALVGRRTSRIVFHSNHIDTTDEDYVTEWTQMIAGRIER
jgi:predicted secreted protein